MFLAESSPNPQTHSLMDDLCELTKKEMPPHGFWDALFWGRMKKHRITVLQKTPRLVHSEQKKPSSPASVRCKPPKENK